MKKYIIVIILVFLTAITNAQTLSSETDFRMNSDSSSVPLQKVQFTSNKVIVKYDQKASGNNVLGVILPKLWHNETCDINLMLINTGRQTPDDSYTIDIYANKSFKNLKVMIDMGRSMSKTKAPWDFIGGMVSSKDFTVEAYILTRHPLIGYRIEKSDPVYAWAAYHPEHAFVALGSNDKSLWGFAGTKKLKNFGTFTVVNYNPQNKNFWIKSQSGFGEINQNFFAQETYVIAAEYLTIPLFFHKHFSPICAKGGYALKLEGKKSGKIQNYEVMVSKMLSQNNIGLALGINSEYESSLKLAPSIEAYKLLKIGDLQSTIELRYDMIYNSFSGYLIVKI